MKPIVADANLVAYCGLYCGACGAFLKGRCPGCHENAKASWCKVRSCCRENQWASCADCQQHQEAMDCKKFNNFIAKIFGLIFRSDRAACVHQIRALGVQGHAERMTEARQQTIKR